MAPNKLRTMSMLRFLHLFAWVLAALFIFQEQWREEWMAALYLPLSLLAGYYFTMARGRGAGWLFWGSLVFFVGILGWECF
jgi:hypothetical protein